MSVAQLPSDLTNTEEFNRVQSQLARRWNFPCPRAPAAPGGLLRVLIVDDEQDTANCLALLVALWGHAAQKAYDSATALGLIARQTPDVVLLDIGMPHMDGCELARRIRRDLQLGDCFLIAVTGFTDLAHRQQCREAGIDLFLIKPVDSSVLETLLDLERMRLGRSRAEPFSEPATQIANVRLERWYAKALW